MIYNIMNIELNLIWCLLGLRYNSGNSSSGNYDTKVTKYVLMLPVIESIEGGVI